MKVLHVFDHSIPLHSGYTFRSRAIINGQRQLGWETLHITSPKHAQATAQPADRETVDGLEFYRTPVASGPLARLPVLNQLAVIRALEIRLERVVREVRPDLLHAHSPALNGVAAVRVGRRFGIPVVYEIRAFWEDAAVDHRTSREGGLRYRLTRGMETWVMRRADHVTTICEGLRSDIVRRGISADKVTVIPNAVDPDKFEFGAAADPTLRRELGLEGKRVLGFIGSFYAYEGLLLLLEAMPLILAAEPDTRLLLVGGGPDEAKLRERAAALDLGDAVRFVGRVPHDQVQSYYDQVDAFVYPRLSMRLTDLVTPLKPLEAMASGRLVVASDVGGHRELIEPGVTGELFAAGSATALAEAVARLFADAGQWQQRRDTARRYVETERCWPVSVGRYQPVFQALTRRGADATTARA